jgi:hypothetical protein
VSEEDLAGLLGVSKSRIQRETDDVYAYMLQHKDFPKYFELMIPNRVRGLGVSDEDLRAAMLATLTLPDGKVRFRVLVHFWLETHYR